MTGQETPRVDLYEQLAAVQHDIWSHWMRHLLTNKSVGVHPGPAILEPHDVSHWWRLIETPYEQLTEKEKDSDREQVDRFWPLLQGET